MINLWRNWMSKKLKKNSTTPTTSVSERFPCSSRDPRETIQKWFDRSSPYINRKNCANFKGKKNRGFGVQAQNNSRIFIGSLKQQAAVLHSKSRERSWNQQVVTCIYVRATNTQTKLLLFRVVYNREIRWREWDKRDEGKEKQNDHDSLLCSSDCYILATTSCRI